LRELAEGRLSLTAIKTGLPATCALAGACEALSEVREVRKTLDALLGALDALPGDAWSLLPSDVLDRISHYLDG
jgi:hypothetical protein